MADIEEKPRDDEVTLTPMEQFREDIKSVSYTHLRAHET